MREPIPGPTPGPTTERRPDERLTAADPAPFDDPTYRGEVSAYRDVGETRVPRRVPERRVYASRFPQGARRDARDEGMDTTTKIAIGLGGLALGGLVAGFVAYNRREDEQRPPDDAHPRFREDGDWNGRYAVAGKVILINRPRAEIYAFWRDLSNQPRFLDNVKRVSGGPDARRSTWTMAGLTGADVPVEVEITLDRENEYIEWASVEGSDFEMRGRVAFTDAPGDRGTYVELELEYVPPAGRLGRTVATVLRRSPQVEIRHGLKRLKMLMETGEIATSAHNRAEQVHGDRDEKEAA